MQAFEKINPKYSDCPDYFVQKRTSHFSRFHLSQFGLDGHFATESIRIGLLCIALSENFGEMVLKSSYNVIRVLCVPILISLSVAVWYIWRWPALWSRSNQVQVAKCDPRADSPVLISLKTKMPVFYDASQWFHMAENYLVQHSILGGENKLTDSRVVVYNFDKGSVLKVLINDLHLISFRNCTDNFKNSLNGFTRLMVYLGTISPGAHTEYIHFLNEPNLIADERQLQPGDGILMSSKAISHAETVFLGQDMSSHERFLRTISATLPSLRGSEQHDNPSMISLSHMDTLLNDSHEFGVDGKSAGICVRYLGSIGSQIIPVIMRPSYIVLLSLCLTVVYPCT